MDLTNENKNPFLPDLLRSVGATVILFALFSFLSRYSFASQRFYRVIMVAFMGACSVALSKSLFSYFRFAAFARRRAPRRADLESYLDDRRTRELPENEPLQFGVSLVLVSVLLILLTMSGKATAHLFGGISAGELAGRYNDYMMAKSQKAFRRAALPRSKTAWLFCHIFISMSIGRMTHWVMRCQTCRLATRTIDFAIVLAIR